MVITVHQEKSAGLLASDLPRHAFWLAIATEILVYSALCIFVVPVLFCGAIEISNLIYCGAYQCDIFMSVCKERTLIK